MIKKIIVLICIAAVVSGGIVFYWPQPFTSLFDENVGMYIRHTERVFSEIGTPTLDSIDTEILIEPGTEQYDEVMKILSKYSYHRSLQTLFGGYVIRGGGNESIWIDTYPDPISNIGAKEILIGSKIYHLGYWGNKKSESMIRDVRAYLQGKDL